MVFELFGEAQELLDTNTLNQRSWNMGFLFFLTAENWTSSHWKLVGTRDWRVVASLHPFGFPRKADAQQHKGEASHWLLTRSEEGIKNVLQLRYWATWGQCFIRNSTETGRQTERQASGKPSDQVFGGDLWAESQKVICSLSTCLCLCCLLKDSWE